MKLSKLIEGQKLKTSGKHELKLVTYNNGGESEHWEIVPSGTVVTVLRKNAKSVRVEFKYRDKDRANQVARLAFEDNPGEVELISL